MNKKGGAMLCLTIVLSAFVLLLLFVVLIFAFEDAFRYKGEFIGSVVTILSVVIVVGLIAMLVFLSKEKQAQLKSLESNAVKKSTCPTCHINLSDECQICPNCKTKIRG